MPVAVVFLLRAVVLVLLWGFVVAAIVAVRHDVFIERPGPPRRRHGHPGARPRPQRSARRVTPTAEKRTTERAAPRCPPGVVVVDGADRRYDGARCPHCRSRSAGLTTATIVLADDYVSNHHARLVPRGDEWLVEDTGSTNGTIRRGGQGHRARRGTRRWPDPDRPGNVPGAAGVSPQLRVGGAQRRRAAARTTTRTRCTPGPRLIAVADGVGGAAGGEVASSVDDHRARAARHRRPMTRPARPHCATRPIAADTVDPRDDDRDPGLAGMSTTLTAILATDDALTLAHIGDSRAYLFRDGVLYAAHPRPHPRAVADRRRTDHRRGGAHPPAPLLDHCAHSTAAASRSWTSHPRRPTRRPLPGVQRRPVRATSPRPTSRPASSRTTRRHAATGWSSSRWHAGGPDNISCIVAEPVDDDRPSPSRRSSAGSRRAAARRDRQRPPAGPPTVIVRGGRTRGPAVRRIGRGSPRSPTASSSCGAVAAVGTLSTSAASGTSPPTNGHVAVYQGVQGNAAGVALSICEQLHEHPGHRAAAGRP